MPNKNALISVVIVVLLAAVAFLGYKAYGPSMSSSYMSDDPTVEEVVSMFMMRLVNEEYSEAYDMTDDNFRKVTSEENLVSNMEPIHAQYLENVVSVNRSSVAFEANEQYGEIFVYTGNLENEDGTITPFRAQVAEIGGEYRILFFAITTD